MSLRGINDQTCGCYIALLTVVGIGSGKSGCHHVTRDWDAPSQSHQEFSVKTLGTSLGHILAQTKNEHNAQDRQNVLLGC